MVATRRYLNKYCKPVAFYSDKHSVMRDSEFHRKPGLTLTYKKLAERHCVTLPKETVRKLMIQPYIWIPLWHRESKCISLPAATLFNLLKKFDGKILTTVYLKKHIYEAYQTGLLIYSSVIRAKP